MAEKTFDELLSGAQTIRDNELPESNTHTLVGEQLVNMVDKIKEEDSKLAELSSQTYNLNLNKKNIPIIEGYTPFSSGEKIGTIGYQPDFSCTSLIYVNPGDVLRVSGAGLNKCYYWSSLAINKDTYIEGENTTTVPDNAVVACMSFLNSLNTTFENLQICIPNKIISTEDLPNKTIFIDTSRYEYYDDGKEYIVQEDKVVLSVNSSKKCKEILCDNAIGISSADRLNLQNINFIFCDAEGNILWDTFQNSGDYVDANVLLYFPPNAYKVYITASKSLNTDIDIIYKKKYKDLKNTSLYYDSNNIKKGNFFFTSVGSNPTLSCNESFGYWIIEVQEGDTLILNVQGGNNARAYVTLDSNFKVIRQAGASLNLIGTNNTLSIESNERYAIIQTNISDDLYDKVNVTLLKQSLLSNLESQDNTEKINILSISNSYGCDGLAFVPSILQSMGINNVECAVAYHAAANLQGHIENVGTDWYEYYYTIDGVWKQESSKNLEYILESKRWDYVVFQQGSADSGKYSTYQPYLENLMKYVFGKINYPVVCAFNVTQPYAIGYSGLSNYENSQEQMYNEILESAQKVKEEYGIKTLVYVAKAVQLARDTDLNQYGDYSEGQLSYDGTHLDGGIGRLLAGYTWILSLLRDRLHTDIYSSNFLPSKSEGLFLPDDNRGNWVDVTSDMAFIAKVCATRAISH